MQAYAWGGNACDGLAKVITRRGIGEGGKGREGKNNKERGRRGGRGGRGGGRGGVESTKRSLQELGAQGDQSDAEGRGLQEDHEGPLASSPPPSCSSSQGSRAGGDGLQRHDDD
eukprot:741934-Hanusia_phi.AAC.1